LGKNVKKNQSSSFVEDMDLFVTLNVATLKTFYVSQYSSNISFLLYPWKGEVNYYWKYWK
jgi:hypothetical protein